MIDLYLIRHGESLANLSPHRVSGRSNHSPLTEDGVWQAKALMRRLKMEKINFDVIYSSPAIRTVKTAYYVLGTEKDLIIDDRLQELDQGDWTGQIRANMYTPDIIKQMAKENWYFKAPKGESQNEVGTRMMEWCNSLLTQKNTVIGVFTHGVAIKCLLRNILGFKEEMTWRFQLQNTSITHLKYDQEVWWPVKINDAGHLLYDK